MPANGSAGRPPDDRLRPGIQYAVPLKLNVSGAEYWIIRLRG
jgi:hypothetical protein